MEEHIPKFKSKEEEAAFWQRTGMDQVSPDELEDVQVERPDRSLSATFAVRFDPKTIDLLRRIARTQNVGATQLVRAWVLDRLKIEQSVANTAEHPSDMPSDFELHLRRTIVDKLFESIPAVTEKAMQEVLDRADQEIATLKETVEAE